MTFNFKVYSDTEVIISVKDLSNLEKENNLLKAEIDELKTKLSKRVDYQLIDKYNELGKAHVELVGNSDTLKKELQEKDKVIEQLKYDLNNSLMFHCPHFLTTDNGYIACSIGLTKLT